MTTESSKNGAMTPSHMNFSGYVGSATILSWVLIYHCFLCSSWVRIRLRLSVTGYAHGFVLLSVVIVTLPFTNSAAIAVDRRLIDNLNS